MSASGSLNRTIARQVTVGAGALAIVWVLFVAASFSDFSMAQSTGYRPVHVNGVYVGNIELFPLDNNAGINIMFHPVNNDLNIINTYRLNWWQAANRPGQPGYPRIDLQNNGGTLPGNPGDDNDPAYYTNNERSDQNIRNTIMNSNNWWMRDFPGPGIQFETWMVTSNGNSVERLVCLNWGIGPGGAINQPNFVNQSQYPDLGNLINNSGFGRYWSSPPTVPVELSRFGIH